MSDDAELPTETTEKRTVQTTSNLRLQFEPKDIVELLSWFVGFAAVLNAICSVTWLACALIFMWLFRL